MRLLSIFLILLFCGLKSFSQDKIYKKGGSTLKVKILEIGVDEIRYKLFEEPEGPAYAIEKDRILKIVFESGRTETYQSNLKDPELYAGQSRNAIKLNFLSPIFGHTQLGYERSLAPGRSIEATVSIIGLGRNDMVELSYYDPNIGYREVKRNAAGLGLGIGYKFIRTPDFINRSVRYAHLLQGSYIKPVFYTGVYGENILEYKTNTVNTKRTTTFYGALNVELGKQWVFSDVFLVDIYGGLGYAFDNVKSDDNNWSSASDEYTAHHFSVIRTTRSPGLAFSGGLKLGMMLGKKKTN
ncbi:hypothetical protein MD537_16575 [Flavihumibacter sediminis]|nr:hypothetical protein [Flavihumibacter sediminis]